ncbi:MAG TPA: hypothetical protein VKX34_00600 [Aequorivita sp.]|nr:hypothetical protein [Aequorivita sp.]
MKIGDKVFCINDTKGKHNTNLKYPKWIKRGEIYTIRNIGNNRVLLEEIKSPTWGGNKLEGPFEPGFNIHRFRVKFMVS